MRLSKHIWKQRLVGDDENTEDGLPSARRAMLLVILKAASGALRGNFATTEYN